MRIDRLLFGSSRFGMAATVPAGACSPGSSQTKRNKILSFAIVSGLSLATGSAGTLTSEDLAALVGSATTGTDVSFLNLFTGGSTGQLPSWTLTETATSPTWSNWTGSLVGQLLGTPFNLSYAGTLTGNTITWNSSGAYGAITVTGGGSGTISYPTSSSFLLAFSDSLVSSGNVYSVSGDLPGTMNADGTFQLGPVSSTETEVGPLPIFLNDELTPGADGYSFKQDPYQAGPTYYRDDHKYAWWLPTIYTSGFLSSSTSFTDSTVPEPETYLLLGTGLLGMAFAIRKTRIKRMSSTRSR